MRRTPRGWAQKLEQLLGDPAQAQARLAAALEMNERMRAKPQVALTRFDLARLLLTSDDAAARRRGRREADAAKSLADELGMVLPTEDVGQWVVPGSSTQGGLRAKVQGPSTVDSKGTHLAIIRTVILRMAAASWVLRAWSVAVVSALVAVASDAVHARFAWLAVFMAIVFWLVDAHFHRQERLYRKVYQRVRSLEEGDVDFSMDTAPVDNERDAWTAVVLSKKLGAFYGAVIACIVVARIVAQYG